MPVDKNQTLEQRVSSLEMAVFRWTIWLAPLLALVILFSRRHLWRWILMDATAGRGVSGLLLQWTTGLALVVLYLVFWWMGIIAHKRCGLHRFRIPWALLASLALFTLADIVVRHPRIQNMVWSAVRVRAGNNFFVRELSLLRLDVAALKEVRPRPNGLVVCGSSQILHAIDTVQLEKEMEQQRPVYRRAMAGFFPLEMCSAIDFLRVSGPQTYCFLLSGFDIGVRVSLFADAMRPLMTRHGFCNLCNVLPGTIKWTEWRSLVDLHCASELELWRMRDYVRRVAWALTGPWLLGSDPGQQALLQQQENALAHLGDENMFLETSVCALNVLFEQLIQEGNRVVVFEGRINPARSTPALASLNARARSLFKRWEENHQFTFIPVEDQAFQMGDDEWLDYTHFNVDARDRYTRYIADYFQQKERDEMQGLE